MKERERWKKEEEEEERIRGKCNILIVFWQIKLAWSQRAKLVTS